MRALRIVFLAVAALFSVTASLAEEGPVVLRVGLVDGGRIPYFWEDTETLAPKGFYIELLNNISAQTGILFDYRFIPQARIRLYMKVGALDLEPGIAKSWRQKPDEKGISVYSRPFVLAEEVIVSHTRLESSPRSFRDLKPGRICKVLGFSGGSTKGHQVITVLNDLQMVKMLNLKRCDYGLMPLDIARYLKDQHKFNIHFSKPLHRFQLSLRLDKQFADLLPQINRAIENMTVSGRMNAMLEKYRMRAVVANCGSLDETCLPAVDRSSET